MKRNVLAWLTAQVPNAHHALILTHNIDFLFVQSVLATKLRQAGNPRITIFADGMCAAQAFRAQGALLDGLGVRYRVVPVDMGAGRRFHPKALLLTGPDRAAVAIGSGNLTHGGMAANREAWTFAISDGEGANLFAGLRAYLDRFIRTLPLAEPLLDGLDAVFDPTQAWVEALPPATGLAGSPSDIPLLDQVTQFITGDVHAISVLAPYYDEQGIALSTIASRFAAPVTCWMQPGRVGLSQVATEHLPQNVTLKSIDCKAAEVGRRPSFIHAKVLTFHRQDDVVLAVGSANCSQAALLADNSWGNAELMVVGTVTHEVAEALFSDLVRSDEAPDFPLLPPADDWEKMESQPLRILAARHEGERLDVAFRAVSLFTDLVVEATEGAWPAASVDVVHSIATFVLPRRLRTIAFRARGQHGESILSPDAWVDDEASLSAPATLRRMLRSLQESDAINPIQAFSSILELFRDYLHDPQAAHRRIKHHEAADGPPRPYDPAVVFSDNFGCAGLPVSRRSVWYDETTSILSIIETIFAIRREAVGATYLHPGDRNTDEEGEDPPISEDIDEIVFQKRSTLVDEKASHQLRRVLRTVETALIDPVFVETRAPALLGADLALAAILLVKGLADGLVDVMTFREVTRTIWGAIFFGETGAGDAGSLSMRVESVTDPAERDNFIAAFSTPRLAAALALWSTTEWNAGDAEALWFRLSAAQLQKRYPWLFATAAPEVLVSELHTMGEALLPSNERTAAKNTWIEVVRAGEALRVLEKALKSRSREDLRLMIKSGSVGPSDLLWVNGHLAVPVGSIRLEDGVNAKVIFLGKGVSSKYRASHIFPVHDLVKAGVLDFLPGADLEVLTLIETAQSLGQCRDKPVVHSLTARGGPTPRGEF